MTERSFLTPRGPVRIGLTPLVMGVVNATPNSFSDAGEMTTLDAQLARAESLLEAGADLIDVGGQSGVTNEAEIPVEEELRRVLPLVRALADRGVLLSVDTYRPEVAEAVLDAGAAIVNDTSGLLYPDVAEVCARAGAGLVVMHNRGRPKQRLTDPALYDDVVEDVVAFLRERIAVAGDRGLDPEHVIVDPGPDFAKTPAQTVRVLRELDRVEALGRPVLLALSRKDFLGVVTGRRPKERLAATLGAIAAVSGRPGQILRVHDVAEVRDLLSVLAVLRGDEEIDEGAELPEHLRREPPRPEPAR
ncbi:MAG TPA: dihydropteroate synthase [Capillimicrobium sp.]|nr:dihydropteroate synthase [Capillimicrobium sp.]